MTLRKLFPAFSCFFLFFVLLGISGCFGDDVTLKQCDDGSEVNVTEGEKCPAPPPPTTPPPTTPPPTTPPPDDGPPDTSGARSDCNIQVEVPTSDTAAGRFQGTTGDDIICGNERDDVIDGRAGDDTIYGGAGDDILIGSEDRDTLRGEADNDTLRGGQDNDVLDGGEGTDTADYSMENLNAAGDALEGGVPVVVNLAEGHATDTYMDDDTLISIENVIGTVGVDTITGDNGNNEIDGNGGADTLDGGAGSDTIVVTANFDLDTDQGPDDTIKNFENIRARAAADGTPADVSLTGNSGRNKITANNAPTGNTLTGEGGDDELIGGQGTDNLIGGSGRDTLTGGGGIDCFQLDVSLTTLTTNSEMAAAIRSTADRIMDYEVGEAINVLGAAEDSSTALGTRTITLEAENGRVVVVIAAVEAVPTNTPPIPAQGAQRVVVATGSNIVSTITPGTAGCSL